MKNFYSVSMLYSCASLAYEEQETQIVDLGHMPMAVLSGFAHLENLPIEG